MELFLPDGCLSDEGLNALASGSLDELERLEAAEHLSYCDHCMDRYTALLTEDILEPPPRSVRSTVMTTIWVRVMQNTYGRAAVAAAAAVLALSFRSSPGRPDPSAPDFRKPDHLPALRSSGTAGKACRPDPQKEPAPKSDLRPGELVLRLLSQHAESIKSL